MKNTFKTTLIAIALFSAPLASFAARDDASQKETFDLPTYKVEEIATLPEPTRYPIPSVKSQYIGLSLKVKLTVNEQGKPESVRLEKPLHSYHDVEKMSFANRLQESVKSWRFEPAYNKSGDAISVNVILPIQVVKKAGDPTALASLVLDTSDRS